ncbi:hypothetical protein Ddc_14089 [Ditylenchus destructor]|nr:hypothetical protein Ddc_14089 [Ditylenchus destructor]
MCTPAFVPNAVPFDSPDPGASIDTEFELFSCLNQKLCVTKILENLGFDRGEGCGTIEQSDKVIAQTIEVLNTKLLDLYSIRLAASGGVSPDGFLSTTGVLNCDKVTFTKMRLTSDMIAVFVKWLYWKQRQKNSRRHLIFERCILLYDIVSWLKEVFLAATGPVNYVVSFVQCMDYIPSLISDMEFSLENKETGERMTMLKFREKTNRKIIFRFWRRIPVESDNQKNVDAEHLSMLSGKCAPNGSFDKDFYEF